MLSFKICVLVVSIVFSDVLIARDCDKFSEFFNRRYSISLLSDDTILIKDNIDNNKPGLKVAINDFFNGPMDRHSKTIYQLLSKEQDKVVIKYEFSSDTRSMGGNLQSCSGIITVEL